MMRTNPTNVTESDLQGFGLSFMEETPAGLEVYANGKGNARHVYQRDGDGRLQFCYSYADEVGS